MKTLIALAVGLWVGIQIGRGRADREWLGAAREEMQLALVDEMAVPAKPKTTTKPRKPRTVTRRGADVRGS